MKRAAAFLGAWLSFLALWVMFALQSGNATLLDVLPSSVYIIACAAVLGLGVARVCARVPWTGELRLRFYLAHVAAAAIFSGLWVALVDIVERPPWSFVGRQLLMGVWIYLIVAGVSYAIQMHRRALQAEKSLSAARLDAIRSRLHPHFLFNALHTVGALVRHDAAEAEGAVEKLGDMLRYTLRDGGAENVPLAEEWEFTRRYLEFEQLRYGARLHVVSDIDPRALDCPAPAFALQTLVENAVRHSIDRRPEGGRVEISAKTSEDRLQIRVRDDGNSPPDGGLKAAAPQSGARYGLQALRERLESVYGSRLDVARDEAGFEVSFTIPARREDADDE